MSALRGEAENIWFWRVFPVALNQASISTHKRDLAAASEKWGDDFATLVWYPQRKTRPRLAYDL